MLCCLFFLNNRGDIVLSRQFRDCLSVKLLADSFRTEIMSKKSMDQCAPVNVIQGVCYIHMKIGDLLLVLTAKSNVHCVMALQYGIRLAQVIVSTFKRVDETTLRDNFVPILEIIDESMDFGYPVLTDSDALCEFISIPDGFDPYKMKDLTAAESVSQSIVGPVPWRASGLVYHVNELFVDVLEEMDMLLSKDGEVLTSSVKGKIVVKNFLSGMPRCELMLNTKAFGEVNDTTESDVSKLQDVAFHLCVRLNRYDEEENNISFVPPDGEFTLMSYRSTVAVSPPLSIVGGRFDEVSHTRTEMQFTLKSEFTGQQVAEQVRLHIPCPENTATARINVGKGNAKYLPAEHAIVWKLQKIGNGEEITFAAETKQVAPTSEEDYLWDRPPIRIEFEFLSESLTGLRITSLPVEEPDYQYQTRKWIRYKTMAGEYQCRI